MDGELSLVNKEEVWVSGFTESQLPELVKAGIITLAKEPYDPAKIESIEWNRSGTASEAFNRLRDSGM